jgi:glucosamine--fructose-6-phosphate aminotransferase (isomerizing)
MPFNEYSTYQEIKTQQEAWVQALDMTRRVVLPDPSDYEQVLFTGCGSTYYLSLAAAALYQELTGNPVRAVPGGELLMHPKSHLLNKRTLLIAVSRSGTTTETVKATENFKQENSGDVVVISNYGDALSHLADVSIVISKGQEESVAQTRSFTSMYVAASAFCARMAKRNDLLSEMDGLPRIGVQLMSDYEVFAKEVGENLYLDRFYFLGSGIRYGLACEANLKMKEMTLTHSEPFHFLEFRHGPMSMVNEKTVVVGLVSETNSRHEQAVLKEMRMLGGKTIALGESGEDVAFKSGVSESLCSVLHLPPLQLMAFYRSVAKGLNPDRPNNLEAVVRLDL